MSLLDKINPDEVRKALPEFKEKTEAFHRGEISKKDYKGFSGKYGSYAQKDQNKHMLRLRMTAGRVTKDKLNFVVDTIGENQVDLAHFSTCQTVQLHDLKPETVYTIMDKALDADIITYGGGGDYPRNVMCSPLSGIEKGEYFDVLPYAEAMADFLMHYIDTPKMPRKLKVAFSNSPSNMTHATFRDLGFVATPQGTFDVYAAGGLGNNPAIGVKVAEDVAPDQILYYAAAMISLFKKNGNYENRAKARTRYMVDTLGGKEAFVKAFQDELEAVKKEEDITLKDIQIIPVTKEGQGELDAQFRVIEQKQKGLYTVRWHPKGGSPNLEVLKEVRDAIMPMKDVELRLGAGATAYIINLTAEEAQKILAITEKDAAKNSFESSVACIGSSICQAGTRDSQALLKSMIKAVNEAKIPDNALPRMNISGCPNSCGTHQIGELGFRGGVKMVDKKPKPAFVVTSYGSDKQGSEKFGTQIGVMTVEDIPQFVVALGKAVEKSGMDYKTWLEKDPGEIEKIAKPFI